MIKDKLSNAKTYFGISENLRRGFEWLINNDLVNMADGKHVIDGENIFANVQSYETKDTAPFEGHRKYIDIQYMIKWKEKVGVTDYTNCITKEAYNIEKDIEFLDSEKKIYQILEEGDFLIFFPQDAHQPALNPDEKLFVKKVIVKVGI